MNTCKNHWNELFSHTDDNNLGWYEKESSQTLDLLNEIPEIKNAVIFLPGAGTSTLIDVLRPNAGKLILNDISDKALSRVKLRLESTRNIIWLCQDIAQPIKKPVPDVDIWIDRAVLHFLIHEKDIKGYFKNLKLLLKKGGYALFAEYSLNGVSKCAGLPVHQYSVQELSETLGYDYKRVSSFNHVYINPNGDPRPYIYALYKREG